MDLENLSDDDLAALDREFRELHEKHVSSEALHKLHTRISAEKERRHTIKSAGHAITSFLNKPVSVPGSLPSLSSNGKDKKKNSR